MDLSTTHPSVNQAATLPCSVGVLGIRSAFRSREAAHWAVGLTVWRWSKRATPLSQRESLGEMSKFAPVACFEDVQACALALGPVRAPNFHRGLNWQTEPVRCPHEAMRRDQPRHGWQREVSMEVEQHFKESRLVPTMTEPEQTLLHSQGGPLAAAPFTCCPD